MPDPSLAVAVIVVWPGATAVTRPLASTVATAGVPDDQVTPGSVAPAGTMVAVSCSVPPAAPMLAAPLAPVIAYPVAVMVPVPVRLTVKVGVSVLLLAMLMLPASSPFAVGVYVITKVVMLPAAMDRLPGGVFSVKSVLLVPVTVGLLDSTSAAVPVLRIVTVWSFDVPTSTDPKASVPPLAMSPAQSPRPRWPVAALRWRWR